MRLRSGEPKCQRQCGCWVYRPFITRQLITRGAGVTFSDSAPVPKFLNPDPGPAIFQIWQSDSCSDPGHNHRSNRNLPMFYLRNDHTDPCYCRNWKVTPSPVFPKCFIPDPGLKERHRILPESNLALRIRSHLVNNWHLVTQTIKQFDSLSPDRSTRIFLQNTNSFSCTQYISNALVA